MMTSHASQELSFKSFSFGSMLSLVTMAGTLEVHLLGYYIVVFVSCDSVRVDVDVNNFPF